MARLLSTVEEVFYIAGRGLIPAPPIVPQPNERISAGDWLLLKRPDGSAVRAQITGFAYIHRPVSNDHVIDILLRALSKEDVPVGTEIWSIDASS